MPADRLAALRGADHGDAGRREERAERGHDAQVVALVDVAEVRLGRRDRERDLERPAVERARDAEARVLEDPEHRRVVGDHVGDEPLDAGRGRARRELLQHARADAAALVLVGDGERDLRDRGVAEPGIAREGHDLLEPVGRQRSDQCAALDPVRIDEGLDERRPHGGRAVEAKVEASLGETAQEVGQSVGVGGRGRPQAQRSSVAQDDVDEARREGGVDRALWERPVRGELDSCSGKGFRSIPCGPLCWLCAQDDLERVRRRCVGEGVIRLFRVGELEAGASRTASDRAVRPRSA